MKKSRFTDSKIMAALKRVEARLPVPEICRELGIRSATFYKWRAKFGGMDPDGHFKLPHFWPLKFPQGGTPRLSL